MKKILIKGASIVNEGAIKVADVLIEGGRIALIESNIKANADEVINAEGKYLLPGVIDDQVHFREPGLTHKAEIYTEARAAVAGGVTSYMEMPNTKPPAFTQELLEEKYQIASKRSLANYSFFMGASNDNLEEVLKTDPNTVCGIKIFMGSSTGNMLVDDESVLSQLLEKSKLLIAVHCEDENTIKINTENFRLKYGENIPIEMHPEIRSEEACYISSSAAVRLAQKHNTRLHVLHISTAIELELFDNQHPLQDKRITSEVCVHHLWFDKEDYSRFGTKIKCNPAIKESHNRKALLKGLLDDRLDIIATDHAPHTKDEKQNNYINAPSGVPLVQHSLNMMLEFYHQGFLTLEKIVEKMCHAPAVCFQLKERGFIREGYWADLVLVDLDDPWKVDKTNIYYKCNWSPFEGQEFKSKVTHTIVSGNLAFKNIEKGIYNGEFDESEMGKRLEFERD